MLDIEPSISILDEDCDHVVVALRFEGLKPSRRCKFTRFFRRQRIPDDLISNASFCSWILTDMSFYMQLSLRDENGCQKCNYKCTINQFPCLIDSSNVHIKVKTAKNKDYAYLLMNLPKKSATCDWKSFLLENGCLDAVDYNEKEREQPSAPELPTELCHQDSETGAADRCPAAD